MQIEILSIGNELLWGYTINTNAAWISRELSKLGYFVSRHTVIPDEVEIIRKTLDEAFSRSSLVIATGGLGPTLDDLTRKAVSQGEELSNHLGTAPGLFSFSHGKALFLLPGVPREMEEMFLKEALPRIATHFPIKKPLFKKECSLCLLKELEVDPFLRQEKKNHPDVEIGIFPSYGSLQIVFQSQKPVDSFVRKLEAKFPTFYLGEGKIEQAVHREMIERKKTLALAESITGGAISARLTSLPNASQFLLGSMVVYANSWKERFLQVSHTTLEQRGAVSSETAIEMINGLFAETDADYAIAVTGIAGPSGGSKEKPIGTIYIAVGQRGKKTDCGKILGPPERAACIEWTVQTALGALWRRLVHNTFTFS